MCCMRYGHLTNHSLSQLPLRLWPKFLSEETITENTLGTGNILIFLMAFVVKICLKCRRKWKFWRTPVIFFLMIFAKYDHLKHQSEWKLIQRNFFCETFKLPANFSQLGLHNQMILFDSVSVYIALIYIICKFSQLGLQDKFKLLFSAEAKVIYSRGKFLRILLLLSGNVERNPGPVSNYTLDNVNLCGFYRAALYFVFSHRKLIPVEQGSIETAKEEEGIADMMHIFGQHFSVHQLDFVKIKKNIGRFLKTNKKWNKGRTKNDRDKYYRTFSTVNWDLLDDQTKEKHTICCEECKKYLVHSPYPASNKTQESEKQIQETLIGVKRVVDQGLNELAEKKMKTCNSFTDGLSQIMDEQYSAHFKVTFQDRYEKNRNLAKKRTFEEKRKEKGAFGREILKTIKNQKISTQVERLYGGKMSLRAWDNERKRESFETVEQAIDRTSAEKVKVDSGIKKPKDHVGKISSYNIDTARLEEEVSSWTESDAAIWNKIGKKYVRNKENNVPANSGQIVQEYLSQRETEGFVYTFKGKGLPRKQHPRKCLLRVYNDLTMPVDRPSRDIREDCHEKILSGEIDIGVNIVERQYEKQILTKSGAIETHKFSVFGKKHPLINIRRNLLKKHYKYMRRNSNAYFENIDITTLTERLSSLNELNLDDSINTMKQKLKNFERTRNIIMWHDASVIANHSHILFCVNVMYDPAVFHTSKEYEEISGDTVDVQAEIESPELYIIGRCRSNDEQLGYIETRL